LWSLALLLVAAVGGVTLARLAADNPREVTSSESDLGAARDLDQLVAWSKVVAVADFVEMRQEEVPIASPVDGKIHSVRTDSIAVFEPIEVLKSDRYVGSLIEFRIANSVRTRASVDAEFDVEVLGELEFVKGQSYALFLATFSSTTGDDLGPSGPVAIAKLASNRLEFMLSASAVDKEQRLSGLLATRPSMTDVRAAVNNPSPTQTAPSLGNGTEAIVFGARISRVAEDLGAVTSRGDLDRLLRTNGLTPGTIPDPVICEKAEAVLASAGWETDLLCASP
jgi:hypothetical protein